MDKGGEDFVLVMGDVGVEGLDRGMGLPFIKDIFDGSETIAAFMGNPVNIEREMRLMGKQYLGETTTGAHIETGNK